MMADPSGPPQLRRHLVLESWISVSLGFGAKLEQGKEGFNLREARVKC